MIANGSGLAKITTVRNGAVDDEPAVLPKGEELRKLGPGEEFDLLKALDSRKLLGRGHHGRSDAVSLQVRMNRDPREGRDAIHTWQDHDHTRRAAADLGEDPLPRRKLAAKRLRGLVDGSRGWIEWRPCAEGAVDDLDHRGRVLRRRDRNHKIRNRDAH